jgi:hypothetical protein
MVALAPRCTRLRAGFVVYRKTDFPKGPQAQPAALFFFGAIEPEVRKRKRDVATERK